MSEVLAEQDWNVKEQKPILPPLFDDILSRILLLRCIEIAINRQSHSEGKGHTAVAQ